MNNYQPRSWAASVLGFALMVLAACWALNLAARLLLAVLPIVIGVAITLAVAMVAFRLLRR